MKRQPSEKVRNKKGTRADTKKAFLITFFFEEVQFKFQ